MKCPRCNKVTRFPKCKCKKVTLKPDPLPHYFICLACALKKGGKPVPWPVTAHVGQCPYCDVKDVTCIPIRDFDWPAYKIKAIWD